MVNRRYLLSFHPEGLERQLIQEYDLADSIYPAQSRAGQAQMAGQVQCVVWKSQTVRQIT